MWVLECPDNTQLLSDEESDKEFSLKYQAWIEDLRSNVTRKLDEDMFRYSRLTVVDADSFRAMLHQEAKEKGLPLHASFLEFIDETVAKD